MTYKQIEAAHETRMWIGQVIISSVMTGVALMQNPEINTRVKSKFNKIKNNVSKKFSRKES